MNDLRNAAQQALEALEMEATSPPIPETAAAIDALRAALAQPDEAFCDTHCTWRDHHPDCFMARTEKGPEPIRAALAQPEQLVVGGGDLPTLTKWTPQRKPLTDEEVDTLSRTMVKGGKSVNWLCRAIEKAHGIGDK